MISDVSIVIPAFNAEKTIQRSIESALSQQEIKCDVILVDDCSSDSTVKVASSYPEVSIVSLRARSGANAARNIGLEKARSEFIQFLDADDEISPTKIAGQIAILEKSANNVAICAGSYRKHYRIGPCREIFPYTSDPWIALIKARLGNTCANLFRTNLLRQKSGWNTKQKSSQEYELMFRLLSNGFRVEFDQQVDTDVHETEGSISIQGGAEKWLRFIDLREKIKCFLERNNELTDLRAASINEMHLVACRALYTFDKDLAVTKHRKLLAMDYIPTRYSVGYQLAYRVLGFSTTQRVRFIAGRLD